MPTLTFLWFAPWSDVHSEPGIPSQHGFSDARRPTESRFDRRILVAHESRGFAPQDITTPFPQQPRFLTVPAFAFPFSLPGDIGAAPFTAACCAYTLHAIFRPRSGAVSEFTLEETDGTFEIGGTRCSCMHCRHRRPRASSGCDSGIES